MYARLGAVVMRTARFRIACAARLLPLLLILLLPAGAQAQWAYATNADNTIIITGYTGSGGAIAIPDTINGLVVATIKCNVFSENSSLTSVMIKSNVTSIGSDAFYDCTELKSLLIPTSVTYFGDQAFYGCTNAVATIYASGTNTVFGNTDLYGNFYNVGLADLTSIAFSNGITRIGQAALDFYGTSKLKNLLIPTSITWFGFNAFISCTNAVATIYAGGTNTVFGSNDPYGNFCNDGLVDLTSITFSNDITGIGQAALDFYGTSKLKNLLIPTSITWFGFNAFISCTNAVATIY
ncbi:MAG TPA: leucine-rich repeat domain-containing protein, partial [Verrucomicrobiae bacterium]|nr:leucine-rich repeat domain-containing protein [Verrucomicrobiae bacterium]